MPGSRPWRRIARDWESSRTASSPAATDSSYTPARAASARPHSTRWKSSTASGRWITPGLIDCHTHLVYAGDRAHEFEQRLNGVTYETIARSGGGIISTVNATRAASEAQLIAADPAAPRRVAGRRRHHRRDQVRLRTGARARAQATAGGARARAGTRGHRAHHVSRRARTAAGIRRPRGRLHRRSLPNACCPRWHDEGLVDAVDAFCEKHRLHARADPARVRGRAPTRGCASSCTPSNSPTCTARSSPRNSMRCRPITWNTSTTRASAPWPRPGTVAVLLPGAFYFLRDTQLPPLAELRAARRADGAGDRLQSGHLAADLDPAGDEPGGHAVSHDGRGMPHRA